MSDTNGDDESAYDDSSSDSGLSPTQSGSSPKKGTAIVAGIAKAAKPVSGLIRAVKAGKKRSEATAGIAIGKGVVGGVASAFLGSAAGDLISDLAATVASIAVDAAGVKDDAPDDVVTVAPDGTKTLQPNQPKGVKTISPTGEVHFAPKTTAAQGAT